MRDLWKIVLSGVVAALVAGVCFGMLGFALGYSVAAREMARLKKDRDFHAGEASALIDEKAKLLLELQREKSK